MIARRRAAIVAVVRGVQKGGQEELAVHAVSDALPLQCVVECWARGVGAAHDAVKLSRDEPRSADAQRHPQTQWFSACYFLLSHKSRKHGVEHLPGTRDTLCLPAVALSDVLHAVVGSVCGVVPPVLPAGRWVRAVLPQHGTCQACAVEDAHLRGFVCLLGLVCHASESAHVARPASLARRNLGGSRNGCVLLALHAERESGKATTDYALLAGAAAEQRQQTRRKQFEHAREALNTHGSMFAIGMLLRVCT
jgi:hypothetical protein